MSDRSNISPAPWRWEEGMFSRLCDANGDDVLTYTRDDDGIHGKPADKAVIAAAPDLLAALKAIEGNDEVMRLLQRQLDATGAHICGNVRAAIAKAEGR